MSALAECNAGVFKGVGRNNNNNTVRDEGLCCTCASGLGGHLTCRCQQAHTTFGVSHKFTHAHAHAHAHAGVAVCQQPATYFLSNGTCAPCKDPNALTCNYLNGYAATCKPGYVVYSGGCK